MFGLIGLVVMHFAARRGLALVRGLTPVLLVAAFGLTIAVMLPGVGVTVNGATRWLGAGPFQFQPSELLKVAARAVRSAGARRAPATRYARSAGWPSRC